MKRLIFLFIILLSAIGYSTAATKWFRGVVVLQSLKVLSGQVAVHPVHDLVLFKTDEGELSVFPSNKITSVHYYDGEKNINRKFISLLEKTASTKKFTLYEIVIHGDVSVLRRPRFQDPRDEVASFDYFVRLKGNNLALLHQFRTKIFPELVRLSENRVSEYVSGSKLNPNKAADAIRIIEFFNRQDYSFKQPLSKAM